MVPSIDVFMSGVAHILQQPFKFQTKNFVLKVRCSFIIEYFVFSFFFFLKYFRLFALFRSRLTKNRWNPENYIVVNLNNLRNNIKNIVGKIFSARRNVNLCPYYFCKRISSYFIKKSQRYRRSLQNSYRKLSYPNCSDGSNIKYSLPPTTPISFYACFTNQSKDQTIPSSKLLPHT